ncbi:helix-turn-helix transcriptional regulator [Paenibacillus koleovorans]|uniref:helix-turn-helix transcriptional regulator n=1 Tax=Paenibacillus koleovorans TaxID=121608 RepID=UPI000FDB7A42|nr:AraC family transcriptional regulator [Paenibacillus koleovorans]
MKPTHTIATPLNIRYSEEIPDAIHFHSHLHHEVYYFNGGACSYLIGDKLYELAPGDLILMHGMTLHSPHIGSAREYRRTTIHFDPDFVQGLIGPSFGSLNLLQPFQELRNHRLRLNGSEREEIEAHLRRMLTLEAGEDATSARRLQAAFLELLILIYGLCEKPMEALADDVSDRVKHVQNMIGFLEAHYMEDLHMEQLEDALHLSKYYLSKIFKEVTGVTVFDFLYQRRINQAKIWLLVDKRMSITDIGYQAGFKHPSHFSRMFKQLVGSTPEQYRKTNAYSAFF